MYCILFGHISSVAFQKTFTIWEVWLFFWRTCLYVLFCYWYQNVDIIAVHAWAKTISSINQLVTGQIIDLKQLWKMSSCFSLWFQLLKREDTMPLHQCNLNIFVLWSVGLTKQAMCHFGLWEIVLGILLYFLTFYGTAIIWVIAKIIST